MEGIPGKSREEGCQRGREQDAGHLAAVTVLIHSLVRYLGPGVLAPLKLLPLKRKGTLVAAASPSCFEYWKYGN